jgi:hypothetical protein
MTTQREQINEAKKGNAILFGSNREIRRLPEHLHQGEIVRKIVTGSPYGKRGRGIIVATNERVLLVRDGWVFRNTQDFPLETISSVEFSTGWFFGVFSLFGKGDEVAFNWVGRNAGDKFAKLIRELVADYTRSRQNGSQSHNSGQTGQYTMGPPTGVIETPQDAVLRQLDELGQLRDRGVINTNEFEVKKQVILNQLN